MKVLDFGSLNYDYVYGVDHMVQPGETISAGSMETFCGGKGLNQGFALAKAGVPVYLAGSVGEEGQMFLDACTKNGVNTELIRQIPGKSGHAIIQLDKNAQNSILLFGGANRSQSREHMDQVLSQFEEGDILLLQNEINEMPYLMEQAYAKRMTIVLNPSPFDSHLDACDMSQVSIFLLNEVEGAQIAGAGKEPEEILALLKEKYPQARVVLTLGKDGAVYQNNQTGEQVVQPCIPTQAVDTTAAGDTFTGYFIAGLLKEMPMPEIMHMCAMASSIAVSRKGATDSIPSIEEVKKRLAE